MAFAAFIRDIAEGIVHHRQNITGQVPFNLMKSETLPWVMDGADYLDTQWGRPWTCCWWQ